MSWLLFGKRQQQEQLPDAGPNAAPTTQKPEEDILGKLRQRRRELDPEIQPEEEEEEAEVVENTVIGIEEVDKLFTKLSITDMRQYQQRLNKDIEQTRRKMRRVAGKHYPELINAADSVADMDQSCEKISQKLRSLQTMLDESATKPPSTAKRQPQKQQPDVSKSKIYSIAAQVKVLVDTPDQIWKALGAHQYLQASLLYLIAEEIHQSLCKHSEMSATATEVDDKQSIIDPLLAFPMIERQWSSVILFREQIAAKAHRFLEEPNDNISVQSSMSAICAIVLLEDMDAEMACTLFLAHCNKSLSSILNQLVNGSNSIEEALQSLLARTIRVLTDYVTIFGVPGDGLPAMGVDSQQKCSSWLVATLAGICADCDLPLPSSLQPIWQRHHNSNNNNNSSNEVNSTSSRHNSLISTSDIGLDQPATPLSTTSSKRLPSIDTRTRRRKSSIAGSVISMNSPVVAPSDNSILWAMSDSRKPWALPPQTASSAKHSNSGSGVFLIAKYLPQEIAQFKPPMPRLLDHGAIIQAAATAAAGSSLSEADEDMMGLEYYLNCQNPYILQEILATRVQPCVEKAAKHALALWWQDTLDNIRDAVRTAMDRNVQSVGDLTQIGKLVNGWEANLSWTPDLVPWATVVSTNILNSIVSESSSLYVIAMEPVLQDHGRQLLFAQTSRILDMPNEFLQGASSSGDDILAGHLPWQALSESTSVIPGENRLGSLIKDVQNGMEHVPGPAQALGKAIGDGLQQAWQDGQAWWQQIHGASAQPLATECARYFTEQWQQMVQRLDEFCRAVIKDARQDILALESNGEELLLLEDMPPNVALCVKIAWAAHVLVETVCPRLMEDSKELLIGQCWEPLNVNAIQMGHQISERVGQQALEAWFQYLGRSVGLWWTGQFSVLYYRIPRLLQKDRDATRRDIVQAFSSRGSGSTLQYAALRRISLTTLAKPGASKVVSLGVKCMLSELQSHMQAVGGLNAGLAGGNKQRRILAKEMADVMDVAIKDVLKDGKETEEWDAVQLTTDIRHMFTKLQCSSEASGLLAAADKIGEIKC